MQPVRMEKPCTARYSGLLLLAEVSRSVHGDHRIHHLTTVSATVRNCGWRKCLALLMVITGVVSLLTYSGQLNLAPLEIRDLHSAYCLVRENLSL